MVSNLGFFLLDDEASNLFFPPQISCRNGSFHAGWLWQPLEALDP